MSSGLQRPPMGTASQKPRRGTALVERRLRRRALVVHEQKEMQAALRRDRRMCRVSACQYRRMKLPIDPCHFVKHRGMGGNPKGDRTRRQDIVSLCRLHHDALDSRRLKITALSKAGADGELYFHETPFSGVGLKVGVTAPGEKV